MNVIVVAMVVSVVLSSTLEYSEAIDDDIDSEELCQDIKSNKRRILTMGARGTSQFNSHFYILVEGGYMFKVLLANLHLDAKKQTTSIKLDQKYLRVDELLKVHANLFTPKHRFFFISNRQKDPFLGQLTFCQEHSKIAFQLFDLGGVLPIRNHSQDTNLANRHSGSTIDEYNSIKVMGSVGIDSYTTYGFKVRHSYISQRLTFEADYKDGLRLTDYAQFERFIMNFSSKVEIVTIFYHKEDPSQEAGYYYFLDTTGRITVTQRYNATDCSSLYVHGHPYSNRFEVNLNSFILCHIPPSAKSSSQSPNVTAQTEPLFGIYLPYWSILLGIGAIVVLGGIALYWTNRKNRKKKKLPQDDLNLSSLGPTNVCSSASSFTLVSKPSSNLTTSSSPSSASSVLQSFKSKITNLLKSKKSKQAKAVAKEKKSKVKSKKPKSKV